MKKTVIVGERQADVVNVTDPKPKCLKVHVAPMCTEYKAYVGDHQAEQLGHEAAGEVVAIAQPRRVKAGDRVTVMPQNACGTCSYCLSDEYIHCQDSKDFVGLHGARDGSAATMAQYLLKEEWLLVPIPENVSYEHGSMACCGLGPTFGAMQRINVNALNTIMITGLGPVGLGGVINGTYRGTRVIGVDSNKYRTQKALELGAEPSSIPPMMMHSSKS